MKGTKKMRNYTKEKAKLYAKEMKKLYAELTKREIPCQLKILYDGLQILCNDWDAVCHSGSYGHEDGLIEVMGLGRDEEDDVIGYLTAEDVLDLIENEGK